MPDHMKTSILSQRNSFEPLLETFESLFASVIDSNVYLIHQTAEEFLVRKSDATQLAGLGGSPVRSWRHSLERRKPNLVLADICISYLLFDALERRPLVIDSKVRKWYS